MCNNSKLPNQQQRVTRIAKRGIARSTKTMSLMAFSKTPGPKLTSGFPVRTKVLQLPGSFATDVTLLLARSRTLSAWLKGHSSMRKMVPHRRATISGQRGPVRPHPAALSVAKFLHPMKGLRRSCARLNCEVLETSKDRSSGHGQCQSHAVWLNGWNCWRKSVLTNSTCVPCRSTCWIFDHSAITARSPTTFRLAKTSSSNPFIFAKDFRSPHTAVFERWRRSSSVALAKDFSSPTTFRLPNSSSSNLSSFAKDFRSPNTAVFERRRYLSSVKLAKAARSPVTSVPLRSRFPRPLALDKASKSPTTRVLRSWRPRRFVLFAKRSNEPDTLVSSRSRLHNFGSFAICGCSAPLRSGRPGKWIPQTLQRSPSLGTELFRNKLRGLQVQNRNRGKNGEFDDILSQFFSNNFFVQKILDPFFCCTAKGTPSQHQESGASPLANLLLLFPGF